MKKFFFVLGLLFASSNAIAQPELVPYEETDTYKCFGPNVGWGENGAWVWYICDPWKNADINARSRIFWFASPYPIRMDLIGSRLETINKAEDKKKAIQNAWKRFVTADPATLTAIKEEMIKTDSVPIKP